MYKANPIVEKPAAQSGKESDKLMLTIQVVVGGRLYCITRFVFTSVLHVCVKQIYGTCYFSRLL